MPNRIAWFVDDFFKRHTNRANRLLHVIGIPQAFFGIFQLVTGRWESGIINLFLGYLWQWIGHKYFDKNEAGEVILIKKIIKKMFPLVLTVFLLSAGGEAMALMIKSPAFNDGGAIPDKYTADGRDMSPPLFWEDVPDGAVSFAIICEDPDAPGGVWVHWVIYNIVKGTRKLSENIPPYDIVENGAKHGVNDFRRVGYGGPAPPPGIEHRYYFRIYALDRMLEAGSGLTRDELLKAMNGHIIEESELMGRFKR